MLRLGVPPSISAWIVLKVLDFVATAVPEVQVRVFGASQSELQERLRKHALDLAITNFDYTVVLGQDFASRLVAKIPVSFVGTPKIRRGIKRFPADLEKVPLLARTVEDPIRRAVDLYLREREIRPKLEIEIENTLLIRRLAKLHSRPTGIEEYVWLLYNARPKPEPALARAISILSREFSISV